MKGMLLPITCALALAAAAPAALAKGGDDGPGDDHGRDVPAQVQGSDDPAGHDAGDDNGQSQGADDKGAQGQKAQGSDDPAGHDAGDDKAQRSKKSRKAQSRNAGRVAGTCTGRSSSKLKADAPRNGRIQVEFEVESHISGQVWTVQMSDNGATFFKGSKTTLAPGGSFDARAFAKDQAGTDKITASATNPATGETCSASISV